ncbi:hypothetical protein B0H14DRAFT_2624181 [Mycena olivaceomarginata]|nr:hypothetical protein B0H14DRAFT_2624181 [Mycena olivaceomarginata]
MVSTSTPAMPKAMVDSILAIHDAVTATRYANRVKQKAFLDKKTVALEGFSSMIGAIARDKTLYDVFFGVKNFYHQTATGPGGVIGGRYPTILDLCSRIKSDCESIRTGHIAATTAAQQAHHTELEDARAVAEEQAATEGQDAVSGDPIFSVSAGIFSGGRKQEVSVAPKWSPITIESATGLGPLRQ